MKKESRSTKNYLAARYLYFDGKEVKWGTYQDSIKNPVTAFVRPLGGILYIQVTSNHEQTKP